MSAPIAAVVGASFCGLYSAGTVGVTGGPNHGEHPLICTVVHAALFAWLSSGWPTDARVQYGALLAAALAFSIAAVRLTPALTAVRRRWLWLPRAGLVAVYLALVGILVFR